MSFEVFDSQARGARLLAGYLRISPSNGRALIRRSDMRAIGINGIVTILVDTDTKRIGFRKPREQVDGRALEPHATVQQRDGGGTVGVALGGPLRKLGLTRIGAAGSYELQTQKGILYICLGQKWEQRSAQDSDS